MAEVRSDDSSKPIQTFLEKFKDEITEHHSALQELKFDESKLTGLFRDYCDFREGYVPVWPPPVEEFLKAFVPDSRIKQRLGVDQEFRRLFAGEIGKAVVEASKKPIDETDLSTIRTYYDTADWTLGEEIDQLEPDVQEAAETFLDEVVRRDLDTRNIKNLLEQTKKAPWRVNPDIWRKTRPVLERIVAVYEYEIQFEVKKGRPPDFLENPRQTFKDMVSLAQIDTPGQERLEAARRLAKDAMKPSEREELWKAVKKNLEHVCDVQEDEAFPGWCFRCCLDSWTKDLTKGVISEYRGNAYYAVFMEFLLPTALLEAAAELDLPQAHRKPDGKWMFGKRDKVPPEDYPWLDWFAWLRIRAKKLCYGQIMDQPKSKVEYPKKKAKQNIRSPRCPSCGSECVNRPDYKRRSYVCSWCKAPGGPCLVKYTCLEKCTCTWCSQFKAPVLVKCTCLEKTRHVARGCNLGIPIEIAHPADGRPFLPTPTLYAAIASPVDFSGSKDALDHCPETEVLKPKYTREEIEDEACRTPAAGQGDIDAVWRPYLEGVPEGGYLDEMGTRTLIVPKNKEAQKFLYGSRQKDKQDQLWKRYRPTFGFQFNPEGICLYLESFNKEILVLASAGDSARHQELLELLRENCDESIIQILELSLELPPSRDYRTKIAELMGKELQWVNHQISAAKKVIGKALAKEDERKARVKELFLRGLEKGERGYCCREIAAETGIDFSEVLSIVLRLCLKLDPPTTRRLIEKNHQSHLENSQKFALCI